MPGSKRSSAPRMTRWTKIAAAARTVAICSSSLEPKCANSPLLLMSSSVARRPMVSPSSPSTDATFTAAVRIARRVRSPRTLRPSADVTRSASGTKENIARSFVL